MAKTSEYLIIANGHKDLTEEITALMENRVTIAVDGAADFFLGLEHKPDIILGDFDSIQNNHQWGIQPSILGPHEGYFGTTIIPAPDQTFTDLEKAIQYCDISGAEQIVIIHAFGGRLDHTLGNTRLLKKYYRKQRSIQLLSQQEIIEFFHNEDTTIMGKPGDQCALLGFPSGLITTNGLRFDVSDYQLSFAEQESICNQLNDEAADIKIQGEILVIKPRTSNFVI